MLKNKQNFKLTIKKLKTKSIKLKTNMTVNIIGENHKLKFIKQSFDEYKDIYDCDFNSNIINDNKIQEFVENMKDNKDNQAILLLSDEFATQQTFDANVIDNLIYLQSNLKSFNKIIVELLDPINDTIIKDFNINNTIISNKMISLLITKIALYKKTAIFYENLLTFKSDITGKDDQNIIIKKVDELFKEKYPLIFNSSKQLIRTVYESFNKTYMVLGYYKNDNLIIFSGNLNEIKAINLNSDDDLIMIKL